eukprot:scaffold307_cov390-Prasinococcus_capsulatus_cf.AAC.14
MHRSAGWPQATPAYPPLSSAVALPQHLLPSAAAVEVARRSRVLSAGATKEGPTCGPVAPKDVAVTQRPMRAHARHDDDNDREEAAAGTSGLTAHRRARPASAPPAPLARAS